MVKHTVQSGRLLQWMAILLLAADGSCGGSDSTREGARIGGEAGQGADDSADGADGKGGPVLPEACREKGAGLRAEYLSALDAAVDAALREAIDGGGVCVKTGETDKAKAPFAYPAAGGRPGPDNETPRVQRAGSVVSDGRFLDFTASSYPSEVLRLGDLLSEKPSLTRITVEQQAASLLQVDRNLLVFSQKQSGNAAVTRIDIFDGRPALPTVTRSIDLDGEVLSAFRIGSTAYVVVRRAAFNPLADPAALVPEEINCKAVSPKAMKAAFETLRSQWRKSIQTAPLNLAPMITEHRARGGMRQAEVVSDCGGTSGDVPYVYVVALRPVGAVPVVTATVEAGSLLVDMEDGGVFDAGGDTGPLPNPLPVYGLSGADIVRLGTISTEGAVQGAFAADFEGGRLRIFSAAAPDGPQSVLSTFSYSDNTLSPEGKGIGAASDSSTCEVQIDGWKETIPSGARATAFTKDRAFTAACRGLEVWSAGNAPPRSVSTLNDNSAVLHLSVMDNTHLLAAGYALGTNGGTRGVFLRIIDVKNPLSPKVIRQKTIVGTEEYPFLRAAAIRVQGDTVALPIVFGRGKTSGAVFVYRFDVNGGFKQIARIPYGARRQDGRPAEGDRVFLKTGRVFTVTDDFLQVNRTDKPETVLFSVSR